MGKIAYQQKIPDTIQKREVFACNPARNQSTFQLLKKVWAKIVNCKHLLLFRVPIWPKIVAFHCSTLYNTYLSSNFDKISENIHTQDILHQLWQARQSKSIFQYHNSCV